uniref:Putative secreted protein n=1 Tax=Ixodes ricinus TaxID=34613 RepID=A0A6B0UWX0_IXORI
MQDKDNGTTSFLKDVVVLFLSYMSILSLILTRTTASCGFLINGGTKLGGPCISNSRRSSRRRLLQTAESLRRWTPVPGCQTIKKRSSSTKQQHHAPLKSLGGWRDPGGPGQARPGLGGRGGVPRSQGQPQGCRLRLLGPRGKLLRPPTPPREWGGRG